MADDQPQFLEVGSGAASRRIAYLSTAGRSGLEPGLIWLPGFNSVMTSLKVTALAVHAARLGLPMVRFDYSGHGRSEGRLDAGTLSRWLEEVLAVFGRLTRGPQILVGSSMGGFLALLALRHLMREAPDEAKRIKALVLIAPAWDMTEKLMKPRLTSAMRKDLDTSGVYLRPSKYGDGPYPITRALLADGERHQIGSEAFDPGRPIHILHGLLDPDVPWEHTLDLEAHLTGDWVRVSAVPDGDHRLSRPEDLELLLNIVDRLRVVGTAR